MILASIDTETGDTTLFSLPRNTGRMPFPEDSPLHDYYPYGFTNGDGNNPEYFLNAMYQNVPDTVPKDVLGETDNLGADALKLSVGEALGLQGRLLRADQPAGLRQDDQRPGRHQGQRQHLHPDRRQHRPRHPAGRSTSSPGRTRSSTGREALWYARGRYGSDDYARMDRQRCVINAIIKQANPANMLARYEDIAKAGKQIVYTDMPQEVLPLMVDLSLRVKDGNVRSIVFKHGVSGFLSPNPDFPQMRKRVKTALGETKSAKPSGKSTKKPSGESDEDHRERRRQRQLRVRPADRGHQPAGALSTGVTPRPSWL